MSERFPATHENYKDVIDRYYFVGILEHAQRSLDILAHMLGKPKQVVPHANKTERSDQDVVDDELVRTFRRINDLDYKIYDYCRSRYEIQNRQYENRY